jgi:TPR repeat protein
MRHGFPVVVVILGIAAGAPDALAAGCEITNPKPRAELYGDEPNLAKAPLDELLRLAEGGTLSAQNALGVAYGTGIGAPKDSEKSAYWYARAASAGLAISQANLAFMYLNGEGVPKDPELAFAWAEKSAAQGHFRGQLFLGYAYGTGTGVKQDGLAAELCYLAAAKQGNLEAQQTLMRMYERGDGVPQDSAKAILWLHRIRDGVRSGRTWREE